MKKHHMLRTILLSTVFALLALVLITPVASAHTAAPAHGAATATSQVAADLPNVNIVRKHHRSVFSATAVHCKARGPKIACFTITDLTQKTQIVIWQGKVLATIPPGAVAELATSGPNVTSFTLQANSQALLIVIAS